ncbi:EamA family transporter RarD [Staphylococcus aureus]|nr:EamA family transporter RarD [Staphylococcus aureus]
MGILPIYWQFVDAIGAFEILAFRIIFSAIFMIFILAVGQKQRNAFQRDMNQLFRQAHSAISNCCSRLCHYIKLGTFIWAVTNGHVLQTSLGYYINPLVSILLALIFLKERFNKFEWLAILFAFIGVLYMTLKIGEFPIVSIILALSFGTYGLLKKVVHIDAISSITIECIVTAPAGLIYVIYLWQQHQMSFGLNMSSFWLLFSGAITAIPLILFSAGAKRIPLSLIGFIQYVGPTIMFVLGIFVFKRAF